MADMSTVTVQILGVDQLSGPARAAGGALGTLEGIAGRGVSAFTNMAAAAVKAAAAVAAIGAGAAAAGFTSAVSAAANFEKEISGIAAVTGATADQIKGLSATALQLGKDTSFSAAEAARGMSELAKAGVSMADIMGGGARAALDLAAAGGVEVATAAEIASNAMNVFNKTGAEMAHVADVIAGAANASAIDVNDYKFSLAAAGAVAATVGVSFEDLSTAIAVMGQAGIKGSDAGTSLKVMLTNLTPQTKQQIAAARELGILTEDGANAFFDASGKAKSLAEISEVLQNATASMTKQQKLATLETLFGTDALRAAAIMADAGAEGFRDMASAIGAVSAQDVANTRLDNLTGSIEKLKGSVETIAISFGLKFTPALKRGVDILTDLANRAEPAITAFAGRAADRLDRLITTVTQGVPAMIAFGQGLLPLARSYLPMLAGAFDRVKELFGGAGDTIGGGISNAIDTLRSAIAPLIPVAEAVGQAFVTNLITNFRFLTDTVLPPLVSIVQQTAGFFVSTLLPAAQQTGNVMRGIFGETLDWLATTVWPPFLDILKQTTQFFTSRILPVLPTVAQALRTVLGESVQWVATVAWPALLTAAGKVVTFLTGTVLPALPGLARQLRDVLGKAIEWVANTGWPMLVDAGQAVATWITSKAVPAITQLVDWLGPKIMAAVTWVSETGWPSLVDAGAAVYDWVMNQAVPALTDLWTWLSPKLQAALDWITTTGWPALVDAGGQVYSWIMTQAVPALTDLWTWLEPKIQAAVTWITETGWPGLVDAGGKVYSWIMTQAVPSLTDLYTWLSEKLQPAVEWLSGTGWPALVEIGGKLNEAWQKTVEFATQLWEQLAKSDIVDILTDAFKNLWDGAKILVETFWPEMKKGADDAATALPEANTVIDALVQIARVGAGFILAFSEGFKVLAESLRAVKEAAAGMPDWLIEGIRRGASVGGFGPGSGLIPGFLPPGGGQTQNQGQRSSGGGFQTSPMAGQSRWSEDQVRQLQDRILTEMPKPPSGGGSGSLENRMQQWAPTLQWLEANTGFPASSLAGLISAENGFGQSSLSSQGNNFFSIARSAYDRFALPGDSRFPSYPNPESNIARALGLILHPENTNYNQAAANRGDLDGFLQGLVSGGYIVDEPGFPVSTWMNNVRAGAGRYQSTVGDTIQLSNQIGQQTRPPINMSNFGQSVALGNQFELGLPMDQALAACGPAAVALFMQATGRTPNMQEVMRISAKNGWTASAGMGGFGAFQRTISDLGINAASIPISEAGASAAAGHLTAISTTGHYFVAQGYDEATGKFDLGETGGPDPDNPNAAHALRGGSRYMTMAEITAYMGQVNGVLQLLDQIPPATAAAGEGVAQLGESFASTQTPMDGAAASMGTLTEATAAASEGVTAAGEAVTASNEMVTASFDVMAQGALTSVTDLGTGVLTTVQDMSGNTIATVTDMAGNVTSQSATMASGVALSMADMGVQTTTSVNEMAGTITTVMTDTAGNAVTTITNMQGQVVGQFATMQTEAGSSVTQMANVSKEQFGAVVAAAGGIPPAIDAVNEAFDNISTPDFRDTVKQFGEASKAAREYAKRVKEAAEATESLPGRKGGEKGGDKDRDDNPFAKRAFGGPVTAGVPYIVGDAGRPELFVPNENGYILPRVPDGGGSARGGDTFNFYGVQPESVFREADRRQRMQELMYRIGG